METPSPERWQRIERLVDDVIELPISEREAWLRAACGDDADLFREVSELVESGEREDAFLGEPVATLAAALAVEATLAREPSPAAPRRIGAYRIVRELGRGGMGTVYIAEREQHFQQRVALKVIRRGLHLDEDIVQRFVEERQLLARLEHANIARLLDGGVTEEGEPWFALELVEGEPIDRWCDLKRLSLEARLELFCTVCDVVTYAHERQIVHRDLKPSNILVRADGTPKLLDFGIARLVTPDTADTSPTRTGLRRLTPEYASPEQLRGEKATAASDVYSLGVLLHELLTGSRPHRVTSGAAREPLRGDLAAIASKALAERPEQRYASPAALAADLRRYLGGQPVRASPKRGTRIAVVALLLVAASIGVWSSSARRAGQPSGATAEPIIAVGHIADYRGATASELARPLADLLATNLARVPSLRSVSTARIYELMAQLGIADDTANPGAYSAAARRAGASMLVEGSLYAVEPEGLRLDLRRIDVATGAVLAAHSVSGKDIFALVDSGTARLSAAIGLGAPNGSIADATTRSEIAYRFYEEGLRAFYRGDAQASRGLLQAALAEDSTLAMAAFYLARGHRGEANLRWFQHALRMAAHASDRERLIITAAWLVWTSNPAAVATADTLTVRYPQELDGHVLAGEARYEAGDYAAALGRMRYVVAADSLAREGVSARCAACDARNLIVDLYVTIDSAAAAEREARLWTQIDPARATPWLRLANVLALLGQTDSARQAFRRAAGIDPTLNGHPGFLAARLIQDGDYETLDRGLREILLSGSADRQLEARWFLTLSLRYQGRYREALEQARAYRAASMRANPGTSSLSLARHEAQVLLELGRHQQSAALFDSIASAGFGNSPSNRARQRTLDLSLAANALAAARDTSGFAARIDTVRTLGARSLLVRDPQLHHHLRGLLLAARGNDEEAAAELRQAFFAPAGYTRINHDLARTLLRLNRPLDAVAVLQPAVRTSLEGSNLYTTRPELHELLAHAWDAAGVPDSALVYYQKLLHAWQRPDPILQPRVAAARDRVAALRAARTPLPPGR